MSVRANLLVALAFLHAGAFIGCSTLPNLPRADTAAVEPALTAECAKQALLARMGANQLFGFKADQWSQEDVGKCYYGWHDFGGNFRINPAARKYTGLFGPPPDLRGCTFYFEGTFSRRDRVWVTDDPVEVESRLGGGR